MTRITTNSDIFPLQFCPLKISTIPKVYAWAKQVTFNEWNTIQTEENVQKTEVIEKQWKTIVECVLTFVPQVLR